MTRNIVRIIRTVVYETEVFGDSDQEIFFHYDELLDDEDFELSDEFEVVDNFYDEIEVYPVQDGQDMGNGVIRYFEAKPYKGEK